MFKFVSIFIFFLLVHSHFVSANELSDQRWQYRWSESEPWKDATSPCSPPNRGDRVQLFLKLIRTHTEHSQILIKDHSFSFELVNENNIVTNYPVGRKGYLAGYEDFIVNIGTQSEVQFRAISDAKNHIGFCKGVFLGNESTLKEKLIRESFVPFTSALVCLFLSVFLLFLSRIGLSPKGFLSTSLTAFLLGTWTFALPNNNFKEFLFSDAASWLWIDQMSIMLFPTALIGILEFLTSGSILRITKILKYIHGLYACASALAVGSGLAKFHQTNLVFNLIIPFTILLIVFEIARKVTRSKNEIIALLIGLFCITIFGVNDLLVGLWIWPENPLMLPLGFVGFSIAVTYSTIVWTEQRKEMTKKLELESAQLSAAVNTIQTVAHDVRRPFTLIKMLVDTLKNVNDTHEQKQLLMIANPEIEQATSSAESLIQELLNLGKPVKLETGLVSITSVIERSLLLVGQAAKGKQANLKLSLNHKNQLQIDSSKIERVFVNILQNALEAMPHRADLTVRTSESESKLSVFLSNTGSYIESEDLQKIFERFHTSGKTNGTGLGLHISKQFVEAHGGQIECQSKRGNSPNESFVEFQITFNCSNFLDRTNVTHQLDRYFSAVKNDSLS
jgi:signal transduction histidine kinase